MPRKFRESELWGKRGIWVTVVLTILGFGAGSIYTRWITIDTQKEYIKQLIYNAVSEIDCNIANAWYTSDNYIDQQLFFSELRNQALWNVYYNKHIIFGDDLAAADQVLNGIYEIDWVNRLALSQYYNPGILIPLSSASELPSGKQFEEAIKDPTNLPLIAIHKDMISRFRTKVAPNLTNIKKYLENKLRHI